MALFWKIYESMEKQVQSYKELCRIQNDLMQLKDEELSAVKQKFASAVITWERENPESFNKWDKWQYA